MSKTFNSFNALKKAIQKEVQAAMNEVVNTSFVNAHSNVDQFYKSVKELWLEWYPNDVTYFDMLPYKWDTCYNWISRYINKHDSKFICEAIKKQRIRQKRELNKKLKYTNTNAYIILIKSNIKRNQLAKYLYVNGAEKIVGYFG